ncbi:hypothetical protein [uncultured Pontibacter sp.]|uniref:hypothetical protein n=1 Tax=uncultured Pontibacter sp. TaxID=453356 RepID=UPI0026394370|nr:hypothetical protein [uncultured Pontibacter sp.]
MVFKPDATATLYTPKYKLRVREKHILNEEEPGLYFRNRLYNPSIKYGVIRLSYNQLRHSSCSFIIKPKPLKPGSGKYEVR